MKTTSIFFYKYSVSWFGGLYKPISTDFEETDYYLEWICPAVRSLQSISSFT